MKFNRKMVLMMVAFVLAVVLASAGIAGAQSVAEDGYPPVIVGDATVTPSTGGCVGSVVTFAGAGMPANSAVAVGIAMDTATDSYMGIVGTTMADAAGNWSLTAAIPSTVTRSSDGATVATWAGSWVVVAVAEDLVSTNVGALTVQDCTVASALPKTGAPIAGLGLLGAGLLTSAGVGIRIMRSRKR
ncbi:MAG: hypothetical protein Q7K29_06710 [Thermoleophilia bacterium]|nr:hypothetical protein [Thermoleophilia bacterium]